MGQGSTSMSGMGGRPGKGSTSPVSGFGAPHVSAGPGGMMAYAGQPQPPGGVGIAAPPPTEGVQPARYPLPYGDGREPVAAGPAMPSPVPGGGVGVPMAGPTGVSSGGTPITATQRVMGSAGNSVPGVGLRRIFGR